MFFGLFVVKPYTPEPEFFIFFLETRITITITITSRITITNRILFHTHTPTLSNYTHQAMWDLGTSQETSHSVPDLAGGEVCAHFAAGEQTRLGDPAVRHPG